MRRELHFASKDDPKKSRLHELQLRSMCVCPRPGTTGQTPLFQLAKDIHGIIATLRCNALWCDESHIMVHDTHLGAGAGACTGSRTGSRTKDIESS